MNMRKYLTLFFVFAATFTVSSSLVQADDCTIDRTLRIGSKGEQVKCLQLELGLTADGSFGPKTKAAVVSFQASNGLTADGVVGPKTRIQIEGSSELMTEDLVQKFQQDQNTDVSPLSVTNPSPLSSEQVGANKWVLTSDSAPVSRMGMSALVFKNKMWIMGAGGSTNPDRNRSNDVWSSEDGTNWTQVRVNNTDSGSSMWSPRYSQGSVVFNNKMWVMGGQDNNGSKNDVWSSEDGVNWSLVTANAAWAPRYTHSVVVFNNKMWVTGGIIVNSSGELDLNQGVWSSEDGVNWNLATMDPGWVAGSVFTTLVFNNKIWAIGGTIGSKFEIREGKTQAWSSSNGITWTQATKDIGSLLQNFSSHGAVVFNNKIWVMGGRDSFNQPAEANEVFSSSDGISWQREVIKDGWRQIDLFATLVHSGTIWVMGGTGSQNVWKLVKDSSTPLTIATDSPLVSGEVGIPYESVGLSIMAKGARTCNWSVSSGSLPNGVTIRSETSLPSSTSCHASLRGSPTSEGTSTFTLTATSGAQSANKQFTLSVNPKKGTFSIGPKVIETVVGVDDTGGNLIRAEFKDRNPGCNSGHPACDRSTNVLARWTSNNPSIATLTCQRETQLSGCSWVMVSSAAAGETTVTATYTDNTGKVFTDSATVRAKAAPPVVSDPLTITTESLGSGVAGVRYTTRGINGGGGLGEYVWSLSSGVLPPGMSLVPTPSHIICSFPINKCTLSFEGTPTTPGTYTFVVKLISANESTTKQFTVVIDPATVVENISILHPDPFIKSGKVGISYESEVIQVEGSSGDYTWSTTSGSLPPGLSLMTGGTRFSFSFLSGTPTTAGTYTFTIGVNKTQTGANASKQFTLTINASGDFANIFDSSPLPSGTVGVAYSYRFNSQTSSQKCTWFMAPPPGLKLEEGNTCFPFINGVPTTVGTYNFLVQLSNFVGAGNATATETKQFTLIVGPATTSSNFKGSMFMANVLSAFPPSSVESIPVALKDVDDRSFHFTRFLEEGSYGLEVKELQNILSKSGYYAGKIDGVFGPKVKEALVKFQITNKLKADGLFGYEVRTFLNK